MKLLLDENLSPRLVQALADVFPGSVHRIGLGSEADTVVWDYARTNRFIIVSKDSDFHERSVLQGYPPKVVWIRRGNCSVKHIEMLLRNRVDEIRRLEQDPDAAYLILL